MKLWCEVLLLLLLMKTFVNADYTQYWNESALPGFECTGKLTQMEETICKDYLLADKDFDLNYWYKYAINASKNKSSKTKERDIRGKQRIWLSSRNKSCCVETRKSVTTECLIRFYNQRISELSDMHNYKDCSKTWCEDEYLKANKVLLTKKMDALEKKIYKEIDNNYQKNSEKRLIKRRVKEHFDAWKKYKVLTCAAPEGLDGGTGAENRTQVCIIEHIEKRIGWLRTFLGYIRAH